VADVLIRVPYAGAPNVSLNEAPQSDEHDVSIELEHLTLTLTGTLYDLSGVFLAAASMLASALSNGGRPNEGTGPADESCSGDPNHHWGACHRPVTLRDYTSDALRDSQARAQERRGAV
jgi:hypothetical protein